MDVPASQLPALRLPLSAVVIAKNEADRIGRCLGSLIAVCDEVLVLDSGSTDDTVAIAVAAGARVDRALEILADEVPDHLKLAGHLRLEHKNASLEELGQLHDPVLTKDAIAGRIRRLLAMADKRAEELGIPDTESSLTPEMLADEA